MLLKSLKFSVEHVFFFNVGSFIYRRRISTNITPILLIASLLRYFQKCLDTYGEDMYRLIQSDMFVTVGSFPSLATQMKGIVQLIPETLSNPIHGLPN